MKKFINGKDTITDEMLEGLSMVMDDHLELIDHLLVRKNLKDEPAKVSIMTIGGSGHEPSSYGFIGKGWECGKVIGDVFAAPGPAAVLEGLKYVDRGEGVLLYVGNHAGDVMSAKAAQKMALKLGMNVEMVVFYDDISSFPRSEKEQRRGLISSLGLGKVLGAASEKGYNLAQMKALAEKYRENAAALAVATSGASHPVTEQMISVIPEGKMIIGMGQHGEGSFDAVDMKSSAETIKEMTDAIVADLGLKSGDKVLAILNGTGSTTYMELMILYKDYYHYLESLGIKVVWKIVGEYLTTQEQAGFQLGLVHLDDELEEMVNAPCDTTFIRK